MHGSEAPPIVHEVLRSPGQPLDAGTLAFMEPRFGHDFSWVRVHADAKAAASAQTMNALAYTVGRDIVFGPGQYVTSTDAGRRLLAHELAHVLQQHGTEGDSTRPSNLTVGRSADTQEREADAVSARVTSSTAGATQVEMPGAGTATYSPVSCLRPEANRFILRRWVSCGTVEPCPARVPGERGRASAASLQVGTLTETPTDAIVQPFDIGSSDVSSLSRSAEWMTFRNSLATPNSRWEILGFTGCEGGIEFNAPLRQARAAHIYSLLSTPARANIDRFAGAPLSSCVTENDTEEGRAVNRSVVFHRTQSIVTIPNEYVQAIPCPPRSTTGVTSLADYVSLLMCAERQTGYSPRNMLAMLRQLYYGKPWSSVSTTSRWDNVIPCSPNLGNPEALLGRNLFQALRNSPEVEGVDVGHVFTGLEAAVCPSASVSFFGGLAVITMSNEDFATWGGDLGAAAAAAVACPQLGVRAVVNEDCGGATGSRPLSFYIGVHAPPQDLEGDIDTFVLRAQLLGIPCAGSAQRRFIPTRPISDLFYEYYTDPSTALGGAHTNRYLCFLQVIGATVSGRSITNLPSIHDPIAARVASFGDAFYTKIKGGSIFDATDIGDRMRIRIAADAITDWFLSWVASRL